MRYRPEIFALYDDLFKEAHVTLTKEGQGLFSRMGGAVRRGWQAINPWAGRARLRENLTDVSQNLAQEIAKKQKIVQHARGGQRELRALRSEYQQGGATPGALTAEQKAHAATKQIADEQAQRASGLGRIATGLGAAGAIGVPGAYLYGRHGAEEERKRTRNLAFGAGAATGLAAPTIVRGLGNIASGVSQTGLFPELQGYEGMNPNTFGGGY